MKITTIGGTYVGPATSLYFAASGSAAFTWSEVNNSLVRQLQSGISPLQEPKPKQLLLPCLAGGTIKFTTQAQVAVAAPDYIMIAVGTLEAEDWSANLCQLKNASEMTGLYLRNSTTRNNISNIPPGGT